MIENDSCDLTYTDANGEEHLQQGGGMAFDFYDREILLTEEDIMEYIESVNALDIQYRDDGTVWECVGRDHGQV